MQECHTRIVLAIYFLTLCTMKKFLVLGLGLLLVACSHSAVTEDGVPAVEVQEGAMMEEMAMPETAMPTEGAAMPAAEGTVTEEASY